MNTLRKNEAIDSGREMLNKVPAVTAFFWIVKVLCTTVGETCADFLNVHLHLGLTNTTYIMGGLLIVTLFFEFKSKKYLAGIYWLAVVLLSIVGTLITDNLTDHFGVPLWVTTVVFSVMLAVVFIAWYAKEKSLSVHTIFTTRREAFYWLAILFTFALGTAAGDLVAEKLKLGYLVSALMIMALIGIAAVAHFRFHLGSIFTFWFAYVLTRPLGASMGDLLSQPHSAGGLGLGTTVTSAVFLATILVLVIYLAITKKDVLSVEESELEDASA
jgi:uncharacterized membrane-anchored protein